MHILIHEPLHTGHHLNYARILSRELGRQFERVTLHTSQKAYSSKEFNAFFKTDTHEIRIDTTAWHPSPNHYRVTNGTRQLESLSEACRKHDPTVVLVPYADGLSQTTALSQAVRPRLTKSLPPVIALHMRTRLAYQKKLNLAWLSAKTNWSLAQQAPWKKVFHLDPVVASRFRWKKQIMEVMPDPAIPPLRISAENARSALGLPLSKTIIGMAGLISTRKGADTLIRAFGNTLPPSSTALLIAGKHDKPAKDAISKVRPGLRDPLQIISIDRFLSPSEFNLAMQSIDIVALPYTEHVGSSSIAIHAAALSKPIIAPRGDWLGQMVSGFDLGYCYDNETGMDLDYFIECCPDLVKNYDPTQKTLAFRQFHTKQNFASHWTNAITALSNNDAISVPVTWHDTLRLAGMGVP